MNTTSLNFRVLTAVACLVGLVVPIMGANPVMAQIATQVANVFILPVVIGGIILLMNKKSLMREQKASWLLNLGLIAAMAFSLIVSYAAILGLRDYIANL
jgi:manganese transport protein